MLFSEDYCNEEYLFGVFRDHDKFILADTKRDFHISKEEYKEIEELIPDILSADYIGKEFKKNYPISIYGDDYFKACYWINEKRSFAPTILK